ncbi:hypothetical protein BT96DRAFT_1010850, partial [Gymnopus androsaceus JB14]
MTQYTSFEPRIPGRQPNPHNFSDDGFPACGTFDDWQKFMAIELYMRTYNFARMARQEPDRTPPSYTNLYNQVVTVALPFDPEQDEDHVMFMRGAFENMRYLANVYNLGMTKHMFKQNQATMFAEAEARYLDFRQISQDISQQLPQQSDQLSNASQAMGEPEPSLRYSTRSHTAPSAPSLPGSSKTIAKKSLTRGGALRVQSSSSSNANIAEAEDEGETHEVSMILKHRLNASTRILEYAVRWKGYGKEHDSFVAENLMNAPDLIKAYKNTHAASFSQESLQAEIDFLFSMRSDENKVIKGLKQLLDLERMSKEYKGLAASSARISRSTLPVTPAACQE